MPLPIPRLRAVRTILTTTLAAVLALLPFQKTHALVAGSYNIRYDNKGDVEKGNSWPQRLPVVAGLIRFHEFDLLRTQEAFHHQLVDLQKLLPDLAYTGGGRDDGKEAGEYSAIFFRKDKFSLLESGTFWLSPTPDTPGRGWDADLPRICTWAKLRKNDGAGNLFVFNGTINAFKPESKTESRIDHVFHTRQFKPVRYGILTDTYRTPVAASAETQSGNFPNEVKFREFQARLPSDHFPVLVEFE